MSDSAQLPPASEPPPAQAVSPMVYLRATAVDTLHTFREPKTIRKVLVVVVGALIAIFTVASRQTHGVLHLVLGLGLFVAYAGAAMAVGAVIARSRTGPRSGLGVYFTWRSALLIIVFGMFVLPSLLRIAGIPIGIAERMLIGFATGLATVLAGWVIWLLLAMRWPHRFYLPRAEVAEGATGPEQPQLRAWTLRITLMSGAVIGAAVALDANDVSRTATDLIQKIGTVLV